MLEMVEVLAQEKSVPREVVFGVLETALASAVKKANFAGEDADIEVHVDRDTGDYQAWRRWLIVADDQGLQEPDRQEMYSDIHDEYPDLNVGDYIRQEVQNINTPTFRIPIPLPVLGNFVLSVQLNRNQMSGSHNVPPVLCIRLRGHR